MKSIVPPQPVIARELKESVKRIEEKYQQLLQYPSTTDPDKLRRKMKSEIRYERLKALFRKTHVHRDPVLW